MFILSWSHGIIHLMLIQFKNKNMSILVWSHGILHLMLIQFKNKKYVPSCFGRMVILHPMLIQFKIKIYSSMMFYFHHISHIYSVLPTKFFLFWSHGDLDPMMIQIKIMHEMPSGHISLLNPIMMQTKCTKCN